MRARSPEIAQQIIADRERARTRIRTINDYGPGGYWDRKEGGKTLWGPDCGDMREDGAAPKRRVRNGQCDI